MLARNYDTDCHMVINTNSTAARGARFLADSTSNLQRSLAKLASGSKIVEPQDDAAGLAVASRFDAQINRTEATRSNIGNAISFKQTQDGYLSKVSKALDRMSELGVMAQDATKSSTDKGLYKMEFDSLHAYVGEVSAQKFNGVDLFSAATLGVLQDDVGTTLFAAGAVNLAASAGGAALTVLSTSAPETATGLVKTAINSVASMRAAVGADLSRLMMTSDHLSVLSENLSASVSRIKDVDVASESAKYAKYNILVQSGTAMLAQANSLPQSALRLLQ
jgi:flagellin